MTHTPIGSEWLEPFRLRYPEEFRNTDDKAQEAVEGRAYEPWTRKSEGRPSNV